MAGRYRLPNRLYRLWKKGITKPHLKKIIMRTIFLTLLFSPLLSFAQKTDVFIKLTDAKGQLIKGDVVLKGLKDG